MPYEPNDIRTPEKQLEKIFKQLKEPTCLLGGWATYHIVNENFEKANGRKYIGSRDIDIGFHIDKHWNQERLRKSEFVSSLDVMKPLFSMRSFLSNVVIVIYIITSHKV